MIVMSSCSSGHDTVPGMWGRSIIYFEGGQMDRAVKVANDLDRYDASDSSFLVGQYMIYRNMANGGSFEDLGAFFKKLSNTDAGANSMYRRDYLAAKSFSRIYLYGNEFAFKKLSADCEKWKAIKPEQCVEYLISDALNRYMSTSRHLDAVYLYEVAWISQQFKLIDKSSADFYLALSLVNTDNNRAGAILRKLLGDGLLSGSMKLTYCKLTNYDAVRESAIGCKSTNLNSSPFHGKGQ